MARPLDLQQSLPGLRRLFAFLRPKLAAYRLIIGGAMFALVCEVALRLFEPWPIKFIIDRVIVNTPHGGESGIALIDRLDPETLLVFAALAIVAIGIFRALANYTNTVAFALVGNRVLTEVRNDLYRHLQRLSLVFHSKARGGDLTVRAISDVGLLKDVAVTAMLPLLGNTFILFGMVGVMLWLNWRLALLTFALTPLFWLFTVRLSRRIQTVARKQRKREGAMAATAAESIGAIKVVQALSLDGAFAKAFSSQNAKSLREGVQAKRLAASLERIVDILIACATALVLWYGAQLVIGGSLTPGDLLVFLFYLKAAFRPARDFAKYTARIAKATAAGERVLEVLEQQPDVRDLPGARPAPRFAGEISFDHVAFAYEPGHLVLHDIDLSIPAGQCVALIGGSGHGKSTLAGLLLRLYDPTDGRVLIDGHNIREFTLESLRRQVSVVLQDTLLFAGSVRENIAYGRPDASDAEIENAARLSNAHDFITALPQGYDTAVGERGVTLSTGQRQRIAIARAAIRNSPILILDEPTTGLDENNERAVSEALEKLSRGKTTVLITHNVSHAARADLIVYLHHGRVGELGSHEELMKLNGRYAALLRLQAPGFAPHPAQEGSYVIAR